MVIQFLFGTGVKPQSFIVPTTIELIDGTQSPYSGVRPGDTVWLEGGIRTRLRISNFHGEPGRPIIFTNLGSQVKVETDYYYGIGFRSSSYVKLIGQKVGENPYGIKIEAVTNSGGVGISSGDLTTHVEFAFCEVQNTGFAGIMAKTEPDCNDPGTWRESGNIQFGTHIHDCYIHDVGGEGLYIGSSFYGGQYLSNCQRTVLPTVMKQVYIHNNRVERTGWDGIQVSSAVEDCWIYDNYIKDCSLEQVPGQMSGIIIGGGSRAECFGNVIVDPYGTGILLFGNGGTRVYNNLIIRPGKKYAPSDLTKKEHGIFVSDKTGEDKTYFGIYQNTIIQPKIDGIRIDSNVDFEVQVYNNAIIDPGAFDKYEFDNTDRRGVDSYIYVTSDHTQLRATGNYFNRLIETAGFQSATVDDYRLSSGSPLIDSGQNLSANGIHNDRDGNPRPFGPFYDIGAYEYTPGSVAELFLLDQELKIPHIRRIGNSIEITIEVVNPGDVTIQLMNGMGQVIGSERMDFSNPGIQMIQLPVTYSGMLLVLVSGLSGRLVKRVFF